MTEVHINLNIEERPETIIPGDQVMNQSNPRNSTQSSGEVQETQSIHSVTSGTSSNNRSDLFIYANSAAQKRLKIIQTFLITNFVANILGILLVTQVISIFVALIVILASICLLFTSIALGKIKIKDKKERFFFLAQIILLGVYLIVAGLRYQGVIGVFYFAALPSCGLFILEIILLPPKQIPFVLKAAFLVQILLLSLKFDGIALNWTFTLLILVCATFMTYLITLMSLICWLSRKANFIWNTGRLLLVLSVISWTLIVLSFTYFTQDSALDQGRQYIFLAGAIYCLGLFCSSIWFKHRLIMLFKQKVLDSLNIERTKDITAKKATFKNVNHEELYFTKISNTFFCQMAEKSLKRTHSYPIGIEGVNIDSENLEEQNKSAIILDNNLTLEKCLICFDKEANSIFLGCYHGGMCSDCAIKTWAKTNKCHICRGKVDSLLKLSYDTEKKCLKVTEKLIKSEEEIEISLQLN